MLFQIESDRFESAYADLLERIQNAMQQTYQEEKEARGLTKTDMADALHIDLSVVSRRLNAVGNITLKTIADMYTAMGREPLSNFVSPRRPIMNSSNKQALSLQRNEPQTADSINSSALSDLLTATPVDYLKTVHVVGQGFDNLLVPAVSNLIGPDADHRPIGTQNIQSTAAVYQLPKHASIQSRILESVGI